MASRRTTRTLVALTVLALGVATGLPATEVLAEPRPTLEQVQKRIDALNATIEMANEDFGGARIELAAAKRHAAVVDGRVLAAQADLARTRRSLSALAAAAYRTGGTDQFVQLVTTSSPQTFLDRTSSLDRISLTQSSQLAAAATAQHRLAGVQAEATQAQRQAQVLTDAMADKRRTIERALAEQQRLLAGLKADERRRLEALRAARLRAAAADAARASRSRAIHTARPTTTTSTPTPTYDGPASGRASIAVQEAYRQLGKPYEWGAAGPDRFDCSGLTMWVWGKAGVSLPHQSRAQYAGGRKVAKSDLQPGDLTFYGDPIHHVGIYIGNGKMISAPQTGDVVKIQNALRSDYVGAVRP